MDGYYAGLVDGQLNLVVFQNADQLRRLLKNIGIKVREDSILDDSGSRKLCDQCGDPLTISTLGNIMPGSTLMFCDDPFCLSNYVASHMPEDPEPSGA